jgi:hypothetical protein
VSQETNNLQALKHFPFVVHSIITDLLASPKNSHFIHILLRKGDDIPAGHPQHSWNVDVKMVIVGIGCKDIN